MLCGAGTQPSKWQSIDSYPTRQRLISVFLLSRFRRKVNHIFLINKYHILNSSSPLLFRHIWMLYSTCRFIISYTYTFDTRWNYMGSSLDALEFLIESREREERLWSKDRYFVVFCLGDKQKGTTVDQMWRATNGNIWLTYKKRKVFDHSKDNEPSTFNQAQDFLSDATHSSFWIPNKFIHKFQAIADQIMSS